jgi:AcrR family transcriptional regulator
MTGRATYRHGDVRAEGLTVALRMLEEHGEQGLSMRGIAQKIGVAHRALHHHFADREGLLRELSASGFTMLADALSETISPRSFMETYLRYGLAHPQLYALMMRQPADAGAACERLQTARDRVIALALAALAEGEADPDEARRRVMRSWMLMHGGLALNASGTLMARDGEAFVAEMMQIAFPNTD